MPKRPRQHLIEDASIKAFSTALPLAWIYRGEAKDYGIDGSVEIVDTSGNVTGKRFFVQLKGTDEPRIERALKVRLGRDVLTYYKSMDLPVLLVRYHRPTDALYVRWASELDPYYAKSVKEGFVFSLNANEKWTSQTANKLDSDLEDWRWLKAPVLPEPLNLRLELPLTPFRGVNPRDIAHEIDGVSESFRHLVRVREIPVGRVRGRVVINAEACLVFLPGGNSSGLHRTPAISSKRPRAQKGRPEWIPPADHALTAREIAADAIMAVGFALHAADHDQMAAELIEVVALHSSILLSDKGLITVAAIMTRARRFEWLVETAVTLAGKGWPTFLSQHLLAPVFLRRLEPDSSEEIVARLERWVCIVEENDNKQGASIAYYNLGRYVGLKTSNWRRAVKHFHHAARLDPAYRSREYFWSELAAIFFNAGRTSWAARAYRKAFTLSESPALLGPLADSLWRIGQYDEAKKMLASLPDADPSESPQWLLLRYVIGDVSQAGGSSTQKRDPKMASGFLGAAEESADVAMKEAHWRSALRSDALCAAAWWNLSINAAKADRHADARAGFIICALIDPNDIEAWTNALAAGRAVEPGTEEDVLLFALCVLGAARTNRDALYREMLSRYKTADQQGLDELSRRVRELISAAPVRKTSVALRMHNEDGSVEEVHGHYDGID